MMLMAKSALKWNSGVAAGPGISPLERVTMGEPPASILSTDDFEMAKVLSPMVYSTLLLFSRTLSARMVRPFLRWMVSAPASAAARSRKANVLRKMFALFKTRLRKGSGADSINKRIPLLRARLITLVMLALCAAPPAQAQSASASLYRRLAAVGIDRTKIFAVRDASIDREDLHLSLNDGVIAFLEPVEGKVTGALFVGEGEVLVVPPSYQERQSLALFTGVAVLSEKFSVAYFRFNDTKFMADLEPGLRQAKAPQHFFKQ